jgi:hypothetical protein
MIVVDVEAHAWGQRVNFINACGYEDWMTLQYLIDNLNDGQCHVISHEKDELQ